MAPNLHWPDTMFSFDHATGVMYTCDGEGRARAGGASRAAASAACCRPSRGASHSACSPPACSACPSSDGCAVAASWHPPTAAPPPPAPAAFGMHYCSDDPYDSQLEPLEPHYRFYYDCLMLPNAK